jgi:imidazolonepropionase-like amidohydrolase
MVSRGPSLFIANVTVISGTGEPPRPGMSIVVTGERVDRIAPAADLTVPRDAVVVDGRGKYAIPGLWNLHVHLRSYDSGRLALAGYAAEGIAGVRDMGSQLDDVLRLRDEVTAGAIIGPHIVAAGPIVQGPLPFELPLFVSVRSEAAARATVRMLHERGVDFIKVQDAISHELYTAVADEATRERIPFAGHVPPTVAAQQASDLGQRSVEHLGGRFWGILVGASANASALRADEARMYEEGLQALNDGRRPEDRNMRAPFMRTVVESYDPGMAASLVDRFRANGTWQCPTLVVLRTLWRDDEARYTAADLAWAERVLEMNGEMVGLMHRGGVRLLTGTDLPPQEPGGSIHDELIALVNAGLSPMDALAAATRNAAEFLGMLDQTGTLEEGKQADVLVLNADPLRDIKNTRAISALFLRGRPVPG